MGNAECVAKQLCGPVHSPPMNPPRGSQPYPFPKGDKPGSSSEALAAAPTLTNGAEVDAKLVLRMQGGDEGALAEFYDRWFPIVSGLINRMLKSADDVEDVVEETFWQAWRQAQRYTPERGSVQTWLLTIARTRALDRLRASRRLREESIDDAVATSGDATATTVVKSASDPSLDVEHAERKQLVAAALSELPREQREALELGYFGGLSQSEIAERTGQPLGTIKTRMRLALLKLRDRLSPLREDAR
jgi:RNA polymerase sigma-70 factor, ECF subfamily